MKRNFDQQIVFVRDAVKIDTGLEHFEREDHYFCFLSSLDRQTLITFGEMTRHLIEKNPGDEITGMSEHHDKRKFLEKMISVELESRDNGKSEEPDLEHDAYHIAMRSMFMATMQPHEKSWGEMAATELSGLEISDLGEIRQNRLVAAIDLTRKTNKTFHLMFEKMAKSN
jgi:hypothetical protein